MPKRQHPTVTALVEFPATATAHATRCEVTVPLDHAAESAERAVFRAFPLSQPWVIQELGRRAPDGRLTDAPAGD